MKKKVLSLVFALCFAFAGCYTAFAVDDTNTQIPPEPVFYGAPVEEKTYYDEQLDATVTERIYFVPTDPDVTLRSKSGKGWYKNEKKLSWNQSMAKATTVYAKGYFVWGNGEVSISYPDGGYDAIPSNATMISSSVDHGTGRYAGVFNQYAYVTYSYVLQNVIGEVRSSSVTIRVSESGNMI